MIHPPLRVEKIPRGQSRQQSNLEKQISHPSEMEGKAADCLQRDADPIEISLKILVALWSLLERCEAWATRPRYLAVPRSLRCDAKRSSAPFSSFCQAATCSTEAAPHTFADRSKLPMTIR